jgi:hypothetical protein
MQFELQEMDLYILNLLSVWTAMLNHLNEIILYVSSSKCTLSYITVDLDDTINIAHALYFHVVSSGTEANFQALETCRMAFGDLVI